MDFAGEDGWERLGHGYQVESRVVLWEAGEVLAVPLTALFRDGEQWALFVAVNGRATLRPVDIGQKNGVLAEIREGVAAGEKVVLHPSDRISDGTRIRSRD
jgi:HlyD family secretion protein